MKRLLSLFLLLSLLITLFAYSDASKAQNNSNSDIYEIERIKSGDYEYAVLDATKKTATLLKIGTEKKEVKIPKTIDGYSIVQVGISWFDYDFLFNYDTIERAGGTLEFAKERRVFSSDGTIVEKLEIPEGVEKIGEYAFENTPNLTKLKLPKSLKKICSANFQNAKKLKSVTFKNTVILGDIFGNTCFEKFVVHGSINGGDADSGDWYRGMHTTIKKLDVLAKGLVEIRTSSKIKNVEILKSVKTVDVWNCTKIDNMYVNGKNTKVTVCAYDSIISNVQFDLGKYKKKKSGKYSWSKPKLEIYCNDDGSVKKSVKYLLKYKLKGKTKTKTVKKNKISKLKSDSKIHVYAVVKLKIKD